MTALFYCSHKMQRQALAIRRISWCNVDSRQGGFMNLTSICDVCGQNRSRKIKPNEHVKCSKIRQRRYAKINQKKEAQHASK